MSLKVLLITVLISLVQFSYSKEFPKSFPRCRPTDDECLVKSANDILHNYPHGFPDIFLDNLEPFKIGTMKLKGDSSKSVNIDLEMTNLTLNGYSKMMFTKFTGFKKDPKNLVIDSECTCKEIEMRGNYKVSGKMLLFPITGEGDIVCKIQGLKIKAQSKPKIEVIDGKDYLRNDQYKIKTKAERMTVHLTNLFNGDKTLGDSMNSILNENWQVLWEDMEPRFIEQLQKVNGDTLQKVFGGFPYNELFIID